MVWFSNVLSHQKPNFKISPAWTIEDFALEHEAIWAECLLKLLIQKIDWLLLLTNLIPWYDLTRVKIILSLIPWYVLGIDQSDGRRTNFCYLYVDSI